MRSVIFFTFCTIPLSYQILIAQIPDTLWSKTYGGTGWDNSYCVQATNDGGYVIVGFTESFGNGSRELWVLKTNQNGDTSWTKTYGGLGQENGYSVQQTSDNGYIVAGQTNSYGAGNYDVYLLKLDASGDIVFTKTYGDVNTDYARDIKITAEGGYVLCGGTSGDAWILKTNPMGETTWTTIITGPQSEVAESICQTSDGGYIVVGATGAFGVADVLLIRLSSQGDSLWAKTFGGPGYDWGHSVLQAADGGYVLSGVSNGEAWILKTDAIGDTVWRTTLYSPQADIAASVCQTPDGGYAVAGASSDNAYLAKTDSLGILSWVRNWGGLNEEWLLSVQPTSDGGFVAAGFTASFGAGNRDAWLLKIEPEVSHLKQDKQFMDKGDVNLHRNYPNPFNPSTTIEFDLPKSSDVTLKIFNILGEEVTTLVSDRLSAGSYSYEWDASNFASGVYLYRLQAGDYIETRKMVLMQ